MEKNNQTQTTPDSLEYWENELQYFEKAKEGLSVAYSIVSSLHERATLEYNKRVPEREEVNDV